MKILNWIKKYKYWIFIVIIYILLFIHMQSVVMYADDYTVFLRVKPGESFLSIILKELKSYYNNWSGRLIGHAVVISGSTIFGINFFRVLNPIMIFLLCLLVAKIINFKLKINLSKILLWLSIIILGLDILISKECLYWADGTILYLWGFVPLLLNFYIILKSVLNNKKLNNLELIICLILCTIINFIMESTQIFNLSFIFLLIVFYYKKILHNKKILFIFLYSLTIFILSFFIPGNLNRFYNNSFADTNLLSIIIQRIYIYIRIFVNCKFNYYLFLVSSIIILKTNYKLLGTKKIFFYILCLFNALNFLNIIVCYATETNFNILYFIIYLLYIIMIIVVGYLNFKKEPISINIILSGFISSLFSVVFTPYWSLRFYFLYVLSSLVFVLYHYFLGSEKEKQIILLCSIFCLNNIISIVVLILFLLKKIIKLDKLNLKYISHIIIILIFSSRFFLTMYYYYRNENVFNYNNKILNNKINTNNIIYLKKFPFPEYSFHQPFNYDYVVPMFNEYYDLNGYTVIWED